MRITHEIEITPSSVRLDGKHLPVLERGEKLLTELYHTYVGDYPKFYKMDTLCRLGFIAAEILVNAEKDEARAQVSGEDRGVVMANSHASIKNDTDYTRTISGETYYPSPALFVYTLPNIVTGEIAIRHKYTGETAFYILSSPEELKPIIESTFASSSAGSLITGWCEATEKDAYYAKIQIIWNN